MCRRRCRGSDELNRAPREGDERRRKVRRLAPRARSARSSAKCAGRRRTRSEATHPREAPARGLAAPRESALRSGAIEFKRARSRARTTPGKEGVRKGEGFEPSIRLATPNGFRDRAEKAIWPSSSGVPSDDQSREPARALLRELGADPAPLDDIAPE